MAEILCLTLANLLNHYLGEWNWANHLCQLATQLWLPT